MRIIEWMLVTVNPLRDRPYSPGSPRRAPANQVAQEPPTHTLQKPEKETHRLTPKHAEAHSWTTLPNMARALPAGGGAEWG
jgi:hypothetical protein